MRPVPAPAPALGELSHGTPARLNFSFTVIPISAANCALLPSQGAHPAADNRKALISFASNVLATAFHAANNRRPPSEVTMMNNDRIGPVNAPLIEQRRLQVTPVTRFSYRPFFLRLGETIWRIIAAASTCSALVVNQLFQLGVFHHRSFNPRLLLLLRVQLPVNSLRLFVDKHLFDTSRNNHPRFGATFSNTIGFMYIYAIRTHIAENRPCIMLATLRETRRQPAGLISPQRKALSENAASPQRLYPETR